MKDHMGSGGKQSDRDYDFDVVVIGEINVDLVLEGNVIPKFGQKEQIVDQANLVVGSSAAIFAFGASRLGLRTAFIGKAGDDLFGTFMLQAMRKRGIDTEGVVLTSDISTGLSAILTTKNDRAILTYPGTIPELQYDEVDFSVLSKARHFHLSSYYLLDNLRPDIPKLLNKVKQMGLSISLDTNYDPREKWDDELHQALGYVDVLFPNEVELQAISGKDSTEEAWRSLSETVPILAIKMGESGAMAKYKGGSPIYQGAYKMETADTVGAGDSFDAGFIYGYLNGWSDIKTLQFAVACGSLSTRESGGTSSQADVKEAIETIQNIPLIDNSDLPKNS